jgi:hypothetical protein
MLPLQASASDTLGINPVKPNDQSDGFTSIYMAISDCTEA